MVVEDVVEVFGEVGLDVNESSIGTVRKGGQQDVWSLFCKLKEREWQYLRSLASIMFKLLAQSIHGGLM